RNAEQRAEADNLLSFPIGVLGILQNVRDVDRSTFCRHPAAYGAAVVRYGTGGNELLSLRRKAARCDQGITTISPPKHRCLGRAAETRHSLHQRLKHRLELDG